MQVYSPKKALLLVAHGSRRTASNLEVAQIAGQLQDSLQADFMLVKSAFLELAEPSIPEGVAACVAAGARGVVVLPYFLNSGRHVAEDIPAEIEKARQQLPDIEITLQSHIGALPEMHDLLLRAATTRE